MVGDPRDVAEFAKRSSTYPFRSLVGFPLVLKYFKEYWKGRLVAVVNFPYGLSPVRSVEFELKEAWDNGASEVDLVVSPYLLKEDISKYKEYMRSLIGLARQVGFDVVKVIVEAPLLSDEELRRASAIVYELGAEYLKTSTGVLNKTSLRDVYVAKVHVPPLEIKASGGIREPIQAISYLAVGASIIGTSTGLQIVEELVSLKKRGVS